MNFLLPLLSNWRLIALGFGVVALAWAGWYVKGKFDRAAEADQIEKTLNETTLAYRDQIAQTAKAESAKLKLSTELAAAQKQREVVTKEVVRYVKAKSDPNCSVSPELLHELNKARGYHVSSAPE